MADFLRVLYTASLSFVVLFIIAKLMGKKQIAQLNFVDYAVGISIGSIAAQMSIDNQIPYYHFITAMVIYLLLDFVVNFISKKCIPLRVLFKGKPILLIYDGKLIYKNIKKSRLDLNDFLSLCRKKNFFDINDIGYCILETDGELSVLPKSHAMPIVRGEMNVNKPNPELSIDLIIDGNVVDKALTQAGKNKDWLYDRLKEKNINSVKGIAIGVFDKQNDDIKIYGKDN